MAYFIAIKVVQARASKYLITRPQVSGRGLVGKVANRTAIGVRMWDVYVKTTIVLEARGPCKYRPNYHRPRGMWSL